MGTVFFIGKRDINWLGCGLFTGCLYFCRAYTDVTASLVAVESKCWLCTLSQAVIISVKMLF